MKLTLHVSVYLLGCDTASLDKWFPISTGAVSRPEDQNAQLFCCEDLTIHVCFVKTVYLNFQNSCTEYSVHSDDWNINSRCSFTFLLTYNLSIKWSCLATLHTMESQEVPNGSESGTVHSFSPHAILYHQ